MRKKIFFSLGTISVIIAPIATVVACGSDNISVQIELDNVDKPNYFYSIVHSIQKEFAHLTGDKGYIFQTVKGSKLENRISADNGGVSLVGSIKKSKTVDGEGSTEVKNGYVQLAYDMANAVVNIHKDHGKIETWKFGGSSFIINFDEKISGSNKTTQEFMKDEITKFKNNTIANQDLDNILKHAISRNADGKETTLFDAFDAQDVIYDWNNLIKDPLNWEG